MCGQYVLFCAILKCATVDWRPCSNFRSLTVLLLRLTHGPAAIRSPESYKWVSSCDYECTDCAGIELMMSSAPFEHLHSFRPGLVVLSLYICYYLVLGHRTWIIKSESSKYINLNLKNTARVLC